MLPEIFIGLAVILAIVTLVAVIAGLWHEGKLLDTLVVFALILIVFYSAYELGTLVIRYL